MVPDGVLCLKSCDKKGDVLAVVLLATKSGPIFPGLGVTFGSMSYSGLGDFPAFGL